MAAPASVPRRLGAALYDLLVVAALWMLVYFMLIVSGAFVGSLQDNSDPRHWLLRGSIAFAYFALCWCNGGRTLGALSWRLRVARADGGTLRLKDAAARFAIACAYLLPIVVLEFAYRLAVPPALYYPALLGPFLLGTLWARIDAQGRALHELALATRVTAA
jgi:uncharacterized RDD family membrane protein YckC